MSRAWQLGADGTRALHAVTAATLTPGDDDVVVAIEAVAGLESFDQRGGGSAAVGSVVAAGTRAHTLLGLRVVFGPHVPCGECETCRRGGAVVCPTGRWIGRDVAGAFAERVMLPGRWVTALSDGLAVPGPTAALLGADAAKAYALYARAGIGPREPTIVIGDSAVARLLTQILTAKGAPPIVVAAHHESTLATVHARIAELNWNHRPLRTFVTDVTDSARQFALALAGPRTMLIFAADGLGTTTAIPVAAFDHELSNHSVVGAHPDQLVEVAALVVRGDVNLAAVADVIEIARATETPWTAAAPGRATVISIWAND